MSKHPGRLHPGVERPCRLPFQHPTDDEILQSDHEDRSAAWRLELNRLRPPWLEDHARSLDCEAQLLVVPVTPFLLQAELVAEHFIELGRQRRSDEIDVERRMYSTVPRRDRRAADDHEADIARRQPALKDRRRFDKPVGPVRQRTKRVRQLGPAGHLSRQRARSGRDPRRSAEEPAPRLGNGDAPAGRRLGTQEGRLAPVPGCGAQSSREPMEA
jgi:hypothetical protein